MKCARAFGMHKVESRTTTENLITMGCTKVAEHVRWQWKINPGDFVIPNVRLQSTNLLTHK